MKRLIRNIMMWFLKAYRKLLRRKLKPIPVLPKGTKYLQTSVEQTFEGDVGVVIVEQQPQFRTILGSGRYRWFVPLPYMVFVVRYFTIRQKGQDCYVFAHLQVGARNSPLETSDDTLHPLPLSNYESSPFVTNLRVCMGTSTPGGRSFDSLPEMVKHVIGGFWQSEFTALDETTMNRWRHLNLKTVWEEMMTKAHRHDRRSSQAAHKSTIRELVPIEKVKFDD